MSNSILKLAIVIIIGFVGVQCATPEPNTSSFTIDVKIVNTSMDSLYLFTLGVDGWELTDSVERTEEGFQFKGRFESAEYISIADKKRNFSIRLLAGNEAIKITSNFENPGQDTIIGSSFQDEYIAVQDSMAQFANRLKSIIEEHTKAEQMGDSATMDILVEEYDTTSELKDNWMLTWVKKNPSSIVAEFLIVNPLMYTLPFKELEPLFDNISPEITNNNLYKIIETKVSILKNTAVGQMAPEISLLDTNGIEQTLSAQFGTYLLIDFWASWCGPCRAENPQMVKIYNTYHENGYNVFGVSLDNKKDKWMEAIQKDHLNWTHVSDLKGWKSEGATTYGVSSIPHAVLIDPNGIIIARGLNADELEAKLTEVFAKDIQ